MRSDEKSLIQSFYEKHHLTGNRLKQSFLEKERGALFSKWIGRNKTVLDLGGRDGTLTRYYCNNNKVIIGDIDEKNKGNLMLCTDIPDKPKEYFYE